ELRFEDEADQEQIYLHAQKDLDLLTEHNRTEVIRNDSHRTVEGQDYSHVKGNEHCTTRGEKRVSVGADCSQTITGTFHQKTGQTMASEARTEVHHKAGAKVVLDAGAELTIAGGGSFIRLDASGVTLSGPGIRINSGGAPGKGSSQSASLPELPRLLDGVPAETVSPPELAVVDQRQWAGPDNVSHEGYKTPQRMLIVDIVGGQSTPEEVTVETISDKGSKE
ncbi:hypothetical protein MD273_17660, partial [Marinobacter pelagius]|nr:hypothetical protein [Marinobacter sp. C7]